MGRCIAPNCTSGYNSNKEPCHFFSVPKNSVSMWQKAIPRKNFIVKIGQVVCEKHFRNEEIMWKREHFDATGKMVGWSEYKVPRLKQGTIPTLFGAHSRRATTTISVLVNVKNEDLPQEELKKESEPVVTNNQVTTSPVQMTNPPELKFLPIEPPAFSFDAIFSDDIAIDLPSLWSRRNITSPLELQAVQFSQWTCRKEGNGIKTICQKEIVIGKNLIVHLCVMGHTMKLEKFNIPTEPLSCASNLEKILKTIDELKVCNGCVFPADNLEMETTFTYKDNAGQVRHKNCPMLLSVIKTCEHCARGRSTLQRKRRRLESATNNNTQRFRLELSTRKKRKMELLRKQRKKQKSAK